MSTAPVRLTERRWITIVASAALAVAAGVVAGGILHREIASMGTRLVILPVAAAIGWWLINRPAVGLAIAVGGTVLFEYDPRGFLAAVTTKWYRTIFAGLAPYELVLGLAGVAVILALQQGRVRWRSAGALTLPLLLLAVGSLSGVVTGMSGGADMTLLVSGLRVLVYLMIVPLLVVQIVTTEERARRVVWIAVGIATAKAAVGLAGWLLGVGRFVGTEVLIYYEPTPNLLLMLLILGALAAVVARFPVPRFVVPSALLAAVTLTLSFRRSFWIATLVAAVIVVVVASGRRGRLIVLATGAVLGIALWAMLTAGGSSDTIDNAALQRVRSLNPQSIEQNTDDRYRLDEQANVYEEIRRHPLTGLGLGVPWVARHPLSMEFHGNRNYTHTTVLWYWLKLGPIGLAAYLMLHATAIAIAFGVWRRSKDGVIRAAALALAAGVVGLALAETTGAFTGVEARVTILVGAAYGWLAATSALARAADRELAEINAAPPRR